MQKYENQTKYTSHDALHDMNYIKKDTNYSSDLLIKCIKTKHSQNKYKNSNKYLHIYEILQNIQVYLVSVC